MGVWVEGEMASRTTSNQATLHQITARIVALQDHYQHGPPLHESIAGSGPGELQSWQ